MVLLVIATFTGLYYLMGPGASFVAGTCDASGLWIVASTLLGFGAAVASGCVASKIGQAKGVKALAGLVVILGVLLAIPVAMASGTPQTFDCANASNSEAMQNARQPVWIAFLNPFIGAAGVMLGGRGRKG